MPEAPEALIINLASAPERMAFMALQLEYLGLSYARLPAVTPETLPKPQSDPYWQRWERPLRVTEMAVLASHMQAWAQVQAVGKPVLILEDDALLSADAGGIIKEWQGFTDRSYISLEVRGRKKLLGPQMEGLARLYQDRTGAAAYLLWPSGAEILLRHAARRAALADAMICAAYDLEGWQAEPALAIQLDQCAAYGIDPPLATRSQIDAVAKPNEAAPGARFRLRRIKAQLRMGWRQVTHLGRAQRRDVAVSAGLAEMAARLVAQDS